MVGSNDEVGGHRNFKTTTNGHSIDCSNDWLVSVGKFWEAAEAANAIVGVKRFALVCRIQVPPGRKELLASSGKNCNAMCRIAIKRIENLAQFAAGRCVNGVGFGAVEDNFKNGSV